MKPPMTAVDMVAARVDERRALVERIRDTLANDPRVAAAALTSSYARGDTDGLSDLDVLVVVRDAAAADFVPARLREVERFSDVVWCQEVVGNAPPGGSYLAVGFQGIGYPQCTDWYWQPLSLAVFPTPSVVLVDKSPVPRSEHASMTEIVQAGRPRHAPPPASPDFTPSDPVAARWTFALSMFWRMSGVAASQLARGSGEEAEQVCTRLESLLSELSGSQAPREASGFERLRSLCAYAERLVPRARELGAFVPEDRSWVAQTIDFMEALVLQGWSSPKRSVGD